MENDKWQCRWSPTLGDLEETHQKVWGTIDYRDNEIDREKPAIFMGLYSLPDFYALWRHKGKKAILWCGSDITRFDSGYWLDEKGELKMNHFAMSLWINKNCESYVENEVEQKALKDIGIESKVVPSFLGDVKDYKLSFKPGNKVYTSVSGDNFELYGWHKIHKLARENLDIEFHLYGNTIPFLNSYNDNIIVHGRVPKRQMNAEIKKMQGALRLTEFDGFSEILAKSVLWGQHPISPFIKYEHMLTDVKDILKIKSPNLEGRDYYLKTLNQYPWNQKK